MQTARLESQRQPPAAAPATEGFLGASGRDSASSCCVSAALRTLRAAWPPRAPLTARADTTHNCRRLCASELSSPCTWCLSAPPAPAAAPSPAPAMPREPVRAGASPGLLRRRYSVPETIMRKYRLAQLSNDSEEPCAATSPSSSSPACGGCGARGAPADRELMRKSALLRRLWGRASAPAQRTSRSLHGSSSELRRSPAGSGWATPKRQRLEWSSQQPGSPPVSPGASPACSDCTFTSHRARSAATRDPASDVFARYSHLASDAARASPPASVRSTPESASLSESLPTALPAVPAPARVFVPDGEVGRYSSLPFDVLSTGSPPYEMLEIVVSETVEAPRPVDSGSPARTGVSSSPARSRANINIDEYVSNILVESLNSLSEQLESMSAAVGGAGVVVEKEIKVRLQNTGVNTIVHLSPTSNHQIIFGNEELCHADNARDACNNPRTSPPTPAPEPNNNEPPDSVNRAVLQQIQKLFHDELYRLEAGPYPGEPTLTQIESSNVDVYIEHHTDSHSEGSPGLGELGVGAGNYWAREPALVPRLSALPHSASMEVNTSSSEAEPSACPSLVDSLDDPASPRVPPPVRRLARSAVDVLDLLPEAPPTRDRAEAFFVRIDEDCDCDKENVVVADRMPDRIRERLLRRHRKRELRMESRRGGGLERARRRAADHDARTVIASLVDELIAKIVQEEYKCMRIQRRARTDRGKQMRSGGSPTEEHNGRIETRTLHGKLSLPPPDAPRRIYQKSEIHDGDKCIEILEILEYVDDSLNSPETTNSDEHHGNSRTRKSRIPIPIYERIQRTTKKTTRGRRSPPAAPSPSSPSPLSPPPARRASVPPPAEPRARAGSLRFRRVFDIIPEERGAGPGVESPSAEESAAGRGSAPSLPPAPVRATRCAATSPPAPQISSRSTMTSPRRSAPSPPPPPPAPRVAAGIALACAPCR